MTTARDIITRALKRASIIEASESASGADSKDALEALNDLLYEMAADGCDMAHGGWTTNSKFALWIPPEWDYEDLTSENRLARALRAQSYQGTWDATANTPTLSDESGTLGQLYKVATAGTTALGNETSWAVDEFLIFDGLRWLKGQPAARFEGAISAMLSVRISGDYGREPKAVVVRDAEDGMRRIGAAFSPVPSSQFDKALVRTQGRFTYFS
ncbi:MAG: hypothetical protein RIC14_00085 [Filomicrobium sp.]